MDDGKRSSLYVTFARGFPKGDNSIYHFGVPQTCGVGGIEWIPDDMGCPRHTRTWLRRLPVRMGDQHQPRG